MGPELLILIIVLIVVLVWRGPASLPRLGEAMGKAVKGVRDNMPSGSKDEAREQEGTESAGQSGPDDTPSSGSRPSS